MKGEELKVMKRINHLPGTVEGCATRHGTLVGPVIGAALVNGAKSFFTVAMPEYWQLFLGLIFIAVTLFLPRGVYGLLRKGEK